MNFYLTSVQDKENIAIYMTINDKVCYFGLDKKSLESEDMLRYAVNKAINNLLDQCLNKTKE